jgi:hypothetical protein
MRAPPRGLTTGGVTQAMFAAGQRAGAGPVYAHQLWHTAATGMLTAGAPLIEIGQVLRHRRLPSTAIYAKADTAALRGLARPWPGGAGWPPRLAADTSATVTPLGVNASSLDQLARPPHSSDTCRSSALTTRRSSPSHRSGLRTCWGAATRRWP